MIVSKVGRYNTTLFTMNGQATIIVFNVHIIMHSRYVCAPCCGHQNDHVALVDKCRNDEGGSLVFKELFCPHPCKNEHCVSKFLATVCTSIRHVYAFYNLWGNCYNFVVKHSKF